MFDIPAKGGHPWKADRFQTEGEEGNSGEDRKFWFGQRPSVQGEFR